MSSSDNIDFSTSNLDTEWTGYRPHSFSADWFTGGFARVRENYPIPIADFVWVTNEPDPDGADRERDLATVTEDAPYYVEHAVTAGDNGGHRIRHLHEPAESHEQAVKRARERVAEITDRTHLRVQEYPEAVIREPQDCIDFGTVQFDLDLIDQGGKRHVVGECVVTGQQFEAIWLVDQRRINAPGNWGGFYLDRVIQTEPERLDTPSDELQIGQYQCYAPLREPGALFGTDSETLGPFQSGQCPSPGEVQERLENVMTQTESE